DRAGDLLDAAPHPHEDAAFFLSGRRLVPSGHGDHSYHGQPDAAARLQAVRAGELELAARPRPLRVDRAGVAAGVDGERGAAVVDAADLDVTVAPDDELGVARDDRVAARHRHRVIGLAAAGAAVATVELGLPALTAGPIFVHARIGGVSA